MKQIRKANNRPNFPELEDKITQFWKQNRIFEKSIEYRKDTPKYSFVDGPPFANGMPHYGHLICSIAKDVIPRYQTMKGNNVRRVFGWDCHGLPIEDKVNAKYNLKTRQDVEEFGIDRYIRECRSLVGGYAENWQYYMNKIGRWVDMDNAYYTMKPQFNESVLWLFKTAWEKGLIYKGKRVSLYSTDNQTPVSEFEVNMDPDNYREVEDTSIFVKFPLKSELYGYNDVKILIWTTTPWTIPAHVAIAVNPELEYSLVEFEGQRYLVSTNLITSVFETDEQNIGADEGKLVRILQSFSGGDLVGLEYEPPYNFFPELTNDKHFKVYAADFVTDGDGTGFVHIAGSYGKEDNDLCNREKINLFESINQEGVMQTGQFSGLYLRDASEPITEDLQAKGRLLRSYTYKHRLPFYRGKNPLIYLAQDSYFIDIQKIKPRMLELNNQINWYPEHLQQGRFRDVIENSPDWCISRNRYWATIMPLWRAEDGEELIIGSIAEMAEYNDRIHTKVENGKDVWYFGEQVLYLHRDVCDGIVLTKEGKEFYRVPEVLDVWMDSGSVPFAEHHYPFENKLSFEESYPADYIVEYVGQIRAWFNVLLRVAVIAFDNMPFKNSLVTGNIAGNDGRKMSKSYGNYPDPREVLENVGGEALRLYLMGNSVMNGEDTNWSDEVLNEQVKNILIPLWNTYSYLTIYAELHNWTPVTTDVITDNILDEWVVNIVDEAVQNYSLALERFDIPASVKVIQPVIDNISTWWIRRSRDRFASGDIQAMQVLYSCLVKLAKALAPQLPFVTEEIYQSLVAGVLPSSKESIHLEDYPTTLTVNETLLEQMQLIRQICSIGLKCRADSGVKLRQPLRSALVVTDVNHGLSVELTDIIRQELNVKEVILTDKLAETSGLVINSEGDLQVGLNIELDEELKTEGLYREIIRQIQAARKNEGLQMGQLVKLQVKLDDQSLQNFIASKLDQIKKDVYLSELIFVDNLDNKSVKIEGVETKLKFLL